MSNTLVEADTSLDIFVASGHPCRQPQYRPQGKTGRDKGISAKVKSADVARSCRRCPRLRIVACPGRKSRAESTRTPVLWAISPAAMPRVIAYGCVVLRAQTETRMFNRSRAVPDCSASAKLLRHRRRPVRDLSVCPCIPRPAAHMAHDHPCHARLLPPIQVSNSQSGLLVILRTPKHKGTPGFFFEVSRAVAGVLQVPPICGMLEA